MTHYMLLLHQGPGNMADPPRDKLMEHVGREYHGADTVRQTGKLVGAEKPHNASRPQPRRRRVVTRGGGLHCRRPGGWAKAGRPHDVLTGGRGGLGVGAA